MSTREKSYIKGAYLKNAIILQEIFVERNLNGKRKR